MLFTDHHARAAAPGPATVYFLDWLETRVLRPERQQRARALFQRLARAASPLGRLETTPQSPPFHAEGPHVTDHVERMLCGLDALAAGVSLAEVEDFVREKAYVLEFQELETCLRSQAAFLTAYTVCHDVAKADVYAQDLKNNCIHYPDHARLGAADAYASTREAVLAELQVPLTHAKLFAELIRSHIDVIHGFNQGPDPVKYAALAAIAERAGLNVSVFLDYLPATVFLDAILGSLVYVKGVYSADLHILLNLFKSEREVRPERHAAREQAVRRGRKTAVQEVLRTAGLDADTVFALLETPYGPVRGQVMAKIHELIQNPERPVDFRAHTSELQRRAKVAHRLLADQNLLASL